MPIHRSKRKKMTEYQPREYIIRLCAVLDLVHQIRRLLTLKTQHVAGLTLEQCIVLCGIDQENGETTISQLAAHLSRTSHTITRVVDVMERRGLVRRHRAQTGDRRLVHVSMTLEGEATLRSFREAAFEIIEPILGSFRETELIQRLDEVIETLSGISGH